MTRGREGIPARAVAALFLRRQRLDRPRTMRLTEASLERFVHEMCGLQIDSVNVVDRAHHLTLWSRFGEFDRDRLHRLAYRRGALFEYLTHVACFIARRDVPFMRSTMEGTPDRWRRTSTWHVRNRKRIDEVEAAIAARGPLGNGDFERPRSMGRADGWWDWKPAQKALDFLWKSGRIAVAERVNFQKRYDIIDRVCPALREAERVPREQVAEQRLLRSLGAMGVAAHDDLIRYWTWPQMMAPEFRSTLRRLVHDGRVVECRVEGHAKPWFMRAEDAPALAAAARARRPSRGTTLLCPFDSFLWHRERILRLWGYFYRIEIYVPGPKRTHGYYTLPILHDGHLIGRVDLKTHRERRTLEARHVHFEPWFASGDPPPGAAWGDPDRDAALVGVAESLASLARFVQSPRTSLGRVTPAKLERPLAQALRALDSTGGPA